MGKRRRSEAEEDGCSSSTATTTDKSNLKRELLGEEAEGTCSSTCRQPTQRLSLAKPSAKHLKLEPYDWDKAWAGTGGGAEHSTLVNGHGGRASSATPKQRRLNGVHVEEPVPVEFQTVWLVRKPRNIPMEELHRMRFTRKDKHRVQVVHGERDMQCLVEMPPKAMMHLECPEPVIGDKKAEMKPVASMRGIVQISEQLTNSEQLSAPPEHEKDDALFMSEPQNCAMRGNEEGFSIAPIRRKPREEEQCRERLQAYGCASTDDYPYEEEEAEEAQRIQNRPWNLNFAEHRRI